MFKYLIALVVIPIVSFQLLCVYVIGDNDLFDLVPTFFELKNKEDGCYHIPGVLGAEDETKWDEDSIIMSSANRQQFLNTSYDGPNTGEGGIFVVSGFRTGKPGKPIQLPISGWPAGVSFQPHGIDIQRKEKTVYAINHARQEGGERIEVFDVITGPNNIPVSLKYKHSIANEWLNKQASYALNSILVVEPNKFYTTQFRGAAPPYGKHELYGPIVTVVEMGIWPSLMVWYCEFNPEQNDLKCDVAADGQQAPNGITANTDKSEIYVADPHQKSISIFSRDSKNNKLERQGQILTHRCDNIKFDDASQTIHCGAIMNQLGYTQCIPPVADKPKPLNFGGGIEFSRSGPNEWQVRELVVTNNFNAVANSLRMDNLVILGSALFDGLYVCPLNKDIKYIPAKFESQNQKTKQDL